MRPSRALVRLAALACVPALAVGSWAPALTIWLVFVAGVVLAALIDAVDLRRRDEVSVERLAPSSLALGAWTRVKLVVTNVGARSLTVAVHDGCPHTVETRDLPLEVDLAPESGAEVSYRVRALERGDASFEPAHVLLSSRFGLWRRNVRLGEPEVVRVYPDFSKVATYALRALENRVDVMGIRKKQRRGEGLDFHQLREYIAGDSLRQIDWKATSRRRKLISREYQEERDQQVLFLLDCGRRMRSADDELAHFDHCLNAVLLTAYIALRQGDAVGMLTFSGADRWIAPRKGRDMLPTLLNQLYDLEATLSPPDYSEAATRTMTLQSRRALVVLVTNIRDEDTEDIRPALEVLRRRHLVVVASLRETAVEDLATAPVADFDGALAKAGAERFLESRRRGLDTLGGRGLLTLDVSPSDLPIALANQYLDVKRAGAL